MTHPEPPPTNPPDAVPPGLVFTKRAKLVRVSDVVPEPIDWLWDGHLARGKLHDISGDPGLGKSTVTIDWGARVTTGKPWPDGQPGTDPAGVVFISVEEGVADTIRPRLAAAGGDLDRVHVITDVVTGVDPATGEDIERLPELPTDLDVIADAIRSVDAALLVIDPLMAVLAGSVNSYRDQDVRRALSPLTRVADQTGTAVIIVRHLNKGDSSQAIYRGGGSIGIIGAARLGYTVARHPEDPNNGQRAVLAAVKANICRKPASLAYQLTSDDLHDCARIDWEGEVDYTADDLLRPAAPDAAAPTDKNSRWLLDYLTEHAGEAPFNDIREAAAAAGIAERTLHNARKRLGVISERSGFPARAVWRLSDAAGSPASPATTPDACTTGSTGATGRAGDGHGSTTPVLPPTQTRRSTGTTGSTGRTRGACAVEIGACARCRRPTRRGDDAAEPALCTTCRTEEGPRH